MMEVKHLFLQGERTVGKSFLLREALRPYASCLAGFYVQRLYEGGSLAGFRVQDVRQGFLPLDRELSLPLDNVFLLHGQKYPSVLERIIAQTECDSLDSGCRMVLMDEIGGMELCRPAFMGPLYRILRGKKPCIGVFKSAANLAHMAVRHPLSQIYLEQHSALEEEICRRGSLLTMTAGTKEACSDSVRNYLISYIPASPSDPPHAF